MELQKIKNRHYLVNGNDQKKMIPVKYENVIESFNYGNLNFNNRFLDNEERFLLETELLKQTIKESEPYVFELIEGKEITQLALVQCKHTENRYEAKFEKFYVKIPSALFQLGAESLKTKRFSDF